MWLLLLACAPPGPLAARAAWIQDELTDDNARWLARSPQLVEDKYAAMGADRYDWMRGTTALFLADQLRPDPERAPTTFLTVPEAATVLTIGDPHIENLGTTLPGEEPDAGVPPERPLAIEWVDLDAATFGPWTLDTRRAALGLAVLATSLDDCAGCDARMVEVFARAYAEEITTRAAGGAGWDADAYSEAPTESPADTGGGDTGAETALGGTIVGTLISAVYEAGAGGAAFDDYTLVEADQWGVGHRHLALDDRLDDEGDGLLALRAREEAQLARLLSAWDAAPAGFRALEAARLYGKGVGSIPAVRYLVLWDRGDDGLADDRILNLREVVDPPSVDGVVPGIGSVYRDNAERIVAVSTTLWSRRDADVRVGAAADGAATFKSTTTSGWFDTFDHAAIVRAYTLGAAGDADLDALAELVGRAMASAHARGTTLNGAPSLPVIAADLAAGGGADALAAERVRDATTDIATLDTDHGLFRALLDDVGPLLGAEVLYP